VKNGTATEIAQVLDGKVIHPHSPT